jgi:hypothetical protein
MNNISELKTLPTEEITTIHSFPIAEKRRYFVAGYVNYDYQLVMLFRGDGTSIQLSWQWFEPSGNETPDFHQFDIIDHGQTIKLGSYEVSARSILIERDPEVKEYYESIRNKDIN